MITKRAVAPASCANLGPGFDSFAVALGGLKTEVEISRADGDACTVTSDGPFAADFPTDESNTAAQVLIGLTAHSGWNIRVSSNLPHGGGLGSSAALITAIVGAGWEWRRPEVGSDFLSVICAYEFLMGNPPAGVNTTKPWLADAFANGLAQGKGQADNPAASYLGGLTAAAMVGGRAIARRFELDPNAAFVILAPNRQILTADARAALPDMVPRREAVETVAHAALMLPALADLSTFPAGLGIDHLHEKYRRPLFPESADILAAMADAGATIACMSGSGPTMLAICHREIADRVREHGEKAMRSLDVELRFAQSACPDFDGLKVDGNAFRSDEV